jgi:diamine N-acetyltransferase
MKIRTATLDDVSMLSELALRSFNDAFQGHPKNHPDDMAAYTSEAFAAATIERELGDVNNVCFVAETDVRPSGYAMMRRFSSEVCIQAERPIELCRLYALGEFVGTGIGRKLMAHCLDFSAINGHDIIWLGVWEFNYRAQAFYKKFGFEKCGEHIFQLGNDPQKDWLFQRPVLTVQI